ncbi:MAG: DUF3606 domain-containing protein [Cytophagaceae bacterium]|nr:MAG: DUF3606 domain-containing protein [Cytophagaceae bacterium]
MEIPFKKGIVVEQQTELLKTYPHAAARSLEATMLHWPGCGSRARGCGALVTGLPVAGRLSDPFGAHVSDMPSDDSGDAVKPRIDLNQRFAAEYWTQEFDCTLIALQTAVAATDGSVAAVTAHLKASAPQRSTDWWEVPLPYAHEGEGAAVDLEIDDEDDEDDEEI